MCSKFQILAQLSPNKRLAICKHNSVHLFWKQLHYSFSRTLLEHLIQNNQMYFEQMGDQYIVWLEHLAIRMNHQDFKDFNLLIQNSALGLSNHAKLIEQPNLQTKTSQTLH